MNKLKKSLASLSLVAAATAGIVVPQVAAPQSASAATCKKVIVGYKPPVLSPIVCAFSPSNPGCFRTPIYAARCGGHF